jgi:hypothetical protein
MCSHRGDEVVGDDECLGAHTVLNPAACYVRLREVHVVNVAIVLCSAC